VTNVTYENVCIRRTKNPIVMETSYTASPETTGTLIPQYRDVVLRDVRVVDGGRVTLEGYDAARPLGITLDGVTVDTPDKLRLRATNAEVTVGPGPMNLPVAGDGVRVQGTPGTRAAPSCAGRFLPFPGR
jgi:polygalacturonase